MEVTREQSQESVEMYVEVLDSSSHSIKSPNQHHLEALEMHFTTETEPSDVDSDSKSEAGTYDIRVPNESEWEDDEWIDDVFSNDEGVKNKLKFLAWIVNVDSNQPAEVLTKVISVLKGLEDERRWPCS